MFFKHLSLAVLVVSFFGCVESELQALYGIVNPSVICVSTCGLKLLETPEPRPGIHPWTCEEFQNTETIVLQAFNQGILDPRFEDTCSKINNWSVYVLPQLYWMDSRGIPTQGTTVCISKNIYVNNASPMSSSLSHELAHVVQTCLPRGGPDEDQWDPTHRLWGTHEHQYNKEEGKWVLVRDENNKPIWKSEDKIQEALWRIVDYANNHYTLLGYKTGYETE